MNICIIAYSRVGGTCFGEWLSKEINRKYIQEPFHSHSVNKKIDLEKIKNYFNISNTKYEYMLNINNRYRNEKNIKKLI